MKFSLPFFSPAQIRRLKPVKYDPLRKRWAPPRAEPGVEVRWLTCATFNVWFGEHHFEQRCRSLLALLEQHRPDVIALQEVTAPFLAGIRSAPWIQREYFLSDFTGATLNTYGVLLLTRFQPETIELHALPTKMGRNLLVARIPVNGSYLTVGTVHMESLDSADTRGEQLAQIFKTLAREQHVVLLGDFNFCASWEEEESRIPEEYTDVWRSLRDDPGYTEDPAVNTMLPMLGKTEAVRFDRMLLRSDSPGWTPRKIQLLGDAPISESLPEVFPSDHFGLLARFEWSE